MTAAGAATGGPGAAAGVFRMTELVAAVGAGNGGFPLGFLIHEPKLVVEWLLLVAGASSKDRLGQYISRLV